MAEERSNWETFKAVMRDIGHGAAEAATRLVIQGRDELANFLYSGRNDYWAGSQPQPHGPTVEQQAEKAVDLKEEIARVEAQRYDVSPNETPDHGLGYLNGYQRGGNDTDRGISR